MSTASQYQNMTQLSLSDEVVFDNSYSWTRAKKLYYTLELHTSDTTDTEVDEVSGGCCTRLAKDLQTTKL